MSNKEPCAGVLSDYEYPDHPPGQPKKLTRARPGLERSKSAGHFAAKRADDPAEQRAQASESAVGPHWQAASVHALAARLQRPRGFRPERW